MLWLHVLAARIRGLFLKRHLERELDEELRAHIEMATEENVWKGMTAEEARYAARRTFGGVEQTKEAYREQRGLPFFDTFFQDIRYAFRVLCRNPGFTTVAILTLALGIGANTAIFSVIDAVMLRMMPVKNPEQLVLLSNPGSEAFSYPEFRQLRDRNQVFSGLFGFRSIGKVTASLNGSAEIVNAQLVSGNYHSVLGVGAAAGRTFTAEDDRVPGGHPVAVISYGFWERRFALDPTVVGKTIRLNGSPFTIIGVTPAEFFGVTPDSPADISVPLIMQAQALPGVSWLSGHGPWLQIMARLSPDVSEVQARAGINVLFRQVLVRERGLGDLKRDLNEQRIELTPAAKGLSELRQQFSRPLLILMTVVGLVLLIACANVANLLLARAAARQKEIAVRLAIGAGRVRLIRLLLTESGILALGASALGLLLARWAGDLLLALLGLGAALNVHPDWRMLGFTAAISVAAGVLFGLAPALGAVRIDLSPALKNTPGSLRSRGRRFAVGKALVVFQVAVSLLLLIGAGLLVRTLEKLMSLDAGFHRDNILLITIDPSSRVYDWPRLASIYREMLHRTNSIPGVRSASLSDQVLLSSDSVTGNISVERYTPRAGENPRPRWNRVAPRFFETVGIRLLAGRDFALRDSEDAPGVAIVNETFVRHYLFGNTSPIGRGFWLGAPRGTPIKIVGVARDAKYNSLREETPPLVYLPLLQVPVTWVAVTLQVRMAPEVQDMTRMASVIRHELHDIDAELPVVGITTEQQQVEKSVTQERFIAALSSAFGLLALLVACVGLYGVMAYSVSRRTNEIGIRIALGAQRGEVLWLVLRETLSLVLIGFAVGIAAALASTRMISSMLFGVRATDPATIALAALLMLAVAALAGYVPARRASRVDPMVALHYE